MSQITAHQIASYRHAEYRVLVAAGALSTFVEHASPELATLFAQHRTERGAIVTACNPRGEVLSTTDNAGRHGALLKRLDREGRDWLPARGIDPDGDYPGEDSVLIFDIARDDALELGRELEQNAIIVIGADATPQLELLR